MSSRIVITDQNSAAVVPNGKFGQITDIYIKAGGGGTVVALYEGQSAVAANLLSIHTVAEQLSTAVTNCKIQFSDTGLYALVDAYTEVLIVWGEWAGAKATPVLSGG